MGVGIGVAVGVAVGVGLGRGIGAVDAIGAVEDVAPGSACDWAGCPAEEQPATARPAIRPATIKPIACEAAFGLAWNERNAIEWDMGSSRAIEGGGRRMPTHDPPTRPW